jgi:hypothetical protein
MIFNYDSWLQSNSEDLGDISNHSDYDSIEDLILLNKYIERRIKILKKWENQKERI